MGKLHQQLTKIRNLLDVTFFRVLLFLIMGLILFVAMYSNVKPEKLDLKLFSVATEAIRSPVTIEDKESTDRKREAAEEQVKDVYVLKKEINENRVDLITSIFNSAADLNKELEADINEEFEVNDTGESETQSKTESDSLSVSDKVTMLKERLSEDVSKDVSDTTFVALLSASQTELSIAKDITITAINNAMRNSLPADEVENGKKRVEEELRYTNLEKNLKNAVIELGRYAIMQNEFFDVNATQELRQQARENVEPVKILQGEIIVGENQLINPEIYRQLELVGLLDNENSRLPFFGLILIIGIMIAALYYYFYGLEVKTEIKQNYVILFSIIFVLTIGLLKGISFIQIEYSEIGYVIPVAMGAMLIKILIDERLALLWTVIIALCASIIFNEGISGSLNINVGIYILSSGIAGILYLSKQNQRSKILQAGLFVSAINLIAILALVFMQNAQYNALDYTFYFVAAFISGIASAVLTIGLLPFFEAGFGILSTMRLIELSNPNHPLLRKILTEAPGTYHHSVMVANLSESACEAIGANGLLARVGCYYHDIGKTNRPQFFIENQMNIENPHDRLPPQTSKNIIIAHATDGAEILRKYKLPKEIVDIAEQHHGTTLLKFFYHKAKENGIDVEEKDFRYPGPKAQTKETAVIGIADSVEAAVRSMSNPNPEQIEGLVRNIIADRLSDGQLNECDLTLRELETVANTLCETLKGIFHSRIEYPEMTKQKVKQA